MDKALLGIVTLVFLIAVWPALVYDVPVAQTDGASYLGYAEAMKEGGFNAENPRYNWPASVEKNVNEYPPLSIMSLAALLYLFNGITLINGLYGAIFAIIGVLFLYWFVEELLDKRTALITAGLFAFSIRAQFTLVVGSVPSFTAYCLTWSALYFLLIAFRKGGYAWLWTIIVTALVSLTYPIQALYVMFMQAMLWLGLWVQEHVELDWGVKIKSKLIKLKDLLPIISYGVVSLSVLCVVLTTYILNSARQSWITQWIQGLIGNTCGNYPCLWKYFFVLDGPLLVTLGIFGFIYAIYKNEWGFVGLGLAGLSIVLFDLLFVYGDVFLLQFLYRYFTTFFVVMATFAAFALNGMLKGKGKQIGSVVLVALFVIQMIKVLAFASMIGPAMLPEDVAATEFLKMNEGSVLYLNNIHESGSFRAFKWVIVGAGKNEYTLWTVKGNELSTPKDYILDHDFHNLSVEEVTEITFHPKLLEGYDYVYVGDYELLTPEMQDALNGTEVFHEGKTRIYT